MANHDDDTPEIEQGDPDECESCGMLFPECCCGYHWQGGEDEEGNS